MKKQVSILLNNSIKLVVIVLFLMQVSCKKSEYTKLVKQEMATGVEYDSLLFGMQFGETKKEFFDRCWKLNKDGVIMQGPKNDFVQYDLPVRKNDSTQHKITMLFYGMFNKQKIMTGMDMKFYYEAWSLWNTSLQSDKLVPVVKDTLQSWFPGNDFIKVVSEKTKKEMHVKVDGNRQIVIEPLADSREVDVRIEDLRYVLEK